MNSNQTHDEAIQKKLAPPGAGIPFPARMVLTYFVGPRIANRAELNQSIDHFEKVHKKIVSDFHKFTPETSTRRILVPKQPGLEDSSRYWSAAMIARHLTIVGQATEKLIEALSNGIIPNTKADTATVKPESDFNQHEQLKLYEQCGDSIIHKLRNLKGLDDPSIRYLHPWFGKLNRRGWTWLYHRHTMIHRKQLRAVFERL